MYKNVYRISDYFMKKLRDSISKEKYNAMLENANPEIIKQICDEIAERFHDKSFIFSYHLNDAWGHRISTVEIYDNTVQCSYRDDKDEYILQSSTIEKIFEIIEKYGVCFQSEDYFVEDDGMYDGYMYRIKFSDRENLYYGVFGNITENFGKKDCPNTNILVNFLNEVFSMLEKSGIDKKYLRFKR